MKVLTSPYIWARWAAVSAAFLLLGACANLKSDRDIAYERVETYLSVHPTTNPKIAGAMRNMKLVKGMTPAQVRATWGDPVNVSPSSGGVTDTWHFDCDYPHYCTGAGRKGRTEDQRNAARAYFKDGRLIESRD